MSYGTSLYQERYRFSDECSDWAEDSKLKFETINIGKKTIDAALEKPIYI